MTLEEDILTNCRTVAVVGLSSNPDRHSYHVASYLQQQGYRIVPVNPLEKVVLGETAYPDLASVPGPIDVVDVFRRSEEALRVVQQAVSKGARAVWMQEGVVSEEAAEYGQRAGLKVVMDRCMMREHRQMLFGH